jgi:ribonuclease BN (tRNA processing enzyme)
LTKAGSALHVVGSSSAVPRPNRANSAYVIRSAGVTLGLELGSGALSKLFMVVDLRRLDALLISHMHADHFLDIVPLRYALKYQVTRRSPLPIFLPPGGRRALSSVVSPFAAGASFFRGVIELHEYNPAKMLDLASARVTFAKTRHYIDAYAMRIALRDGTIAFSSDTAPCRQVTDLAREADIFLCECGLGAKGTETGRRGHSNATESATMAQQAGVKHLVLTHYSQSERAQALHKCARQAFTGRISVADDGALYPLIGKAARARSRKR